MAFSWPSCPTEHPMQVMRLSNPSRLAVRRVTTMILPSRRASTGSNYNSGEDIATTPDGGTYTATCRGEIDFRIQGLRHSAVQEHNHIRKRAKKSRFQSVQRAVEGNDLQHGKHGVLRDLRHHSQHAMLQLYDILGSRYGKPDSRNMLTTIR